MGSVVVVLTEPVLGDFPHVLNRAEQVGVPNPLRNLPYTWVPAGLLEATEGLEVVAHLNVASRAHWDAAPLQGACYDALPNLSEFIALLNDADA